MKLIWKFAIFLDNAIIENVTQDKDIIFQVNDGGSTTEVMRIDGALSSIRIGQSTSSATDGPDAKLDVRGANDNSVSIMARALSVETPLRLSSPLLVEHMPSYRLIMVTLWLVET